MPRHSRTRTPWVNKEVASVLVGVPRIRCRFHSVFSPRQLPRVPLKDSQGHFRLHGDVSGNFSCAVQKFLIVSCDREKLILSAKRQKLILSVKEQVWLCGKTGSWHAVCKISCLSFRMCAGPLTHAMSMPKVSGQLAAISGQWPVTDGWPVVKFHLDILAF